MSSYSLNLSSAFKFSVICFKWFQHCCSKKLTEPSVYLSCTKFFQYHYLNLCIFIYSVFQTPYFFFRFFTLTGSLRKDIPSKVESREKENLQVSILNLDHFCEGLRAIEKHVTDNFCPHNKLQPSMKMNYENIRGSFKAETM